MGYKRYTALLLALVLLMASLAGCAPEEEDFPVSSGPQVTLENTGEAAGLKMAYTQLDEAYQKALEEIIEKYRADFPETEIILVPCDTERQAEELLRTGKADLVQVDSGSQPALAGEGLLWNFSQFHPHPSW